MRPTRAQGRPDTVVWPAGWATGHGQVLDRTHTARVVVGPRSTVAAWNPDTQQMETTAGTPAYDGPASIAIASLGGAAAALVVAEDRIEQRKYQVTLQQAASGIEDDHVVRVTECTDADLVNQTLTIDGVELGSSRFARHLICTLI